jgi:hypothetical protein
MNFLYFATSVLSTGYLIAIALHYDILRPEEPKLFLHLSSLKMGNGNKTTGQISSYQHFTFCDGDNGNSLRRLSCIDTGIVCANGRYYVQDLGDLTTTTDDLIIVEATTTTIK